jgi:hypothetical protein
MSAHIVLILGILLQGNIPKSVKDLLRYAPNYSSQLEMRYDIITESIEKGEDTVEVMALTGYPPTTIYFGDITNDPTHRRNECYAAFFHLRSIATIRRLSGD